MRRRWWRKRSGAPPKSLFESDKPAANLPGALCALAARGSGIGGGGGGGGLGARAGRLCMRGPIAFGRRQARTKSSARSGALMN